MKRGAGQSAVAGAAYRAGEKLRDDRLGRSSDYSRRSHDVRETFILAPDGAPAWAMNREALWNRAEQAERRKDGRPARDFQLGLAWELSPDVQREMVEKFANEQFVKRGHVVDVAIHNYGKRVSDMSEKGRDTIRRWAAHDLPFLEQDECDDHHEPHIKIERNRSGDVLGYKVYQPHAHLFVTPRALDGDEFSSKREREFDRYEYAKEMRYQWPHLQNYHLKREGIELRVSATEGDPDDPRPADTPKQRREYMRSDAYAIEQRGGESIERDVTESAALHNEVVRMASAESSADAQQERAGNYMRHTERVAVWWRNMMGRVGEWRGDVRDKAGEWAERFKERLPFVQNTIGPVDVPDALQPESGETQRPEAFAPIHDASRRDDGEREHKPPEVKR
ncbi:MAG: MobA/MobL family protein [Pseudomonadota bacterium]